jgi:hypothetical protein
MSELHGAVARGFEHANPAPPDPGEQIENRVNNLADLDHKCPAPGARNVGGGGAGGHYALNTEQIKAYAKEVEEVVEEAQVCKNDLQGAHDDITAPAEDKHSHFQAKESHKSMAAAATHLQSVIDYGARFAKDLRASVEQYREAEEQGAKKFGNVAQ